jgi:TatA/E family protein of Tat protein translocase
VDILGVGPMELIVILLLLLVFFGPDRLPEIGAKLGKGVRSMRRATREFSEEIQQARDAIEKPASQITEPIQQIAKPVQDIAQPFQDVKASALALGQTAKGLSNPGQALRDSVMQSMKGDKPASDASPEAATADAPDVPKDSAQAGSGSDNRNSELEKEGAERPEELTDASASDLAG